MTILILTICVITGAIIGNAVIKTLRSITKPAQQVRRYIRAA
jgi:hypothetical protein